MRILMDSLLITIDDLLDLPILREVLLYHVVDQTLLSTDLSSKPLTTLNGQSVTVNTDNYDGYDDGFDLRGISWIDQQHDRADIVIGNVQARNGVVHVIDRVLIPLFDSIVQIATSFDDYDILVELVVAADLVDTLTNDGPFTVFAPRNSAFEKLFAELGITKDDVLALPNLADILKYHLISGYRLASELSSGTTTMLNGQTTDIDTAHFNGGDGFSVDGITLRDAQERVASILFGNVEAKNGVVHVIDRVMLPLFDSVVAVAQSLDDYSSLVAAVVTADLADTLSGPGPFTVFAPNNRAFDDLLSELSISFDELLALPILSNVLLFHTVGDYVLTRDLRSGPIETFHDEQSLDVDISKMSDEKGPFEVDGVVLTDAQFRSSDVILSNVQTRNGVVHVVDRVALPLFESIVEIATALDDFSILVRALSTAALVDTLLGPGPFTVFAPTNDAFLALDLTVDEVLALPNLADILLFHVVADFVTTDALSDGQSIETLNGQNIEVEVDAQSGAVTLNDAAKVGLSNVRAKNGVVHVIDSVLLPN